MRFITTLTLTLTLAACGGADAAGACKDYIDAVDTCVTEAGVDSPIDSATYCAAYDNLSGSAAKDATDLLSCYADTYESADCSTSEGTSAAATALSDCN